MNIWRKVDRKNGVGYTRDNRFIKTERVPQRVVDKLEDRQDFETEAVTKPCLFCEDQATKQRSCNLKFVDLCLHHYETKNLGKIAQQLRVVDSPDPEKPKLAYPKGVVVPTQAPDDPIHTVNKPIKDGAYIEV